MTFILLAFILVAPDQYDVLILDENLSGIDCIQQLELISDQFDRETILSCERE